MDCTPIRPSRRSSFGARSVARSDASETPFLRSPPMSPLGASHTPVKRKSLGGLRRLSGSRSLECIDEDIKTPHAKRCQSRPKTPVVSSTSSSSAPVLASPVAKASSAQSSTAPVAEVAADEVAYLVEEPQDARQEAPPSDEVNLPEAAMLVAQPSTPPARLQLTPARLQLIIPQASTPPLRLPILRSPLARIPGTPDTDLASTADTVVGVPAPGTPEGRQRRSASITPSEKQTRRKRARTASESAWNVVQSIRSELLVPTALRNYERFHGLEAGSAQQDQVINSSAGLAVWASQRQLEERENLVSFFPGLNLAEELAQTQLDQSPVDYVDWEAEFALFDKVTTTIIEAR